MIVLARSEIGRFDVRFAGHSEMNSKEAPNVFASPDHFGVVTGKLEQHLFAASFRSDQLLANQIFAKRVTVRSAKDVFPRMSFEIDDFIADSRVPLLAKPFDFGQLGHRRK